jgi:hypothetical protein
MKCNFCILCKYTDERSGWNLNKAKIFTDSAGNKVVVIDDIIFKSKKNIKWNNVEKYSKQFNNRVIKVRETGDVVHVGNTFSDEYAGSKYSRHVKGAVAKAKANAVQGICEMVVIATEKTFRPNRKSKHDLEAANGWYYYRTRFALPIYDTEKKTNKYNVYSGCLVINCTARRQLHLYDLVDIKKENSEPIDATDFSEC